MLLLLSWELSELDLRREELQEMRIDLRQRKRRRDRSGERWSGEKSTATEHGTERAVVATFVWSAAAEPTPDNVRTQKREPSILYRNDDVECWEGEREREESGEGSWKGMRWGEGTGQVCGSGVGGIIVIA